MRESAGRCVQLVQCVGPSRFAASRSRGLDEGLFFTGNSRRVRSPTWSLCRFNFR